MKKRFLIPAVLLLAVLGAGLAYAAGGTSSDPLISLEYLEGNYTDTIINKEWCKKTGVKLTPVFIYSFSTSSSQMRPAASLGIRQSPRGPRLILPTFTPSGIQLRFKCWVKNRR